MDAMQQITQALSAIPTTPEEKRRAKNKRYYQQNRFIWEWYPKIRKLRKLRDLLTTGGPNENH